MAEEEVQEQQEPTLETSPAAASKKPMLIGLACIVVGAVAGAIALPTVVSAMGGSQPQAEEAKEEPKEPAKPRGVLLEKPVSVMVNLADENARRVLKADIVIEAKDKTTAATINGRLIEIKNSLIALLSEKRLADIEGAEAKEALRREIKIFLNEKLAIPDAVIEVYFDQFIVQ